MKNITTLIVTLLFPLVGMSQNVSKTKNEIVLSASQPYGYGTIAGASILPIDSAKAIFKKALLLQDKESVKFGNMTITKCLWSDKFVINFWDGSLYGGQISKNLRKEMFEIVKEDFEMSN